MGQTSEKGDGRNKEGARKDARRDQRVLPSGKVAEEHRLEVHLKWQVDDRHAPLEREYNQLMGGRGLPNQIIISRTRSFFEVSCGVLNLVGNVFATKVRIFW